jgi:hypothetical protein
MPVIRAARVPRYGGSTRPAALVLAGFIATASQPWMRQALCAQTDPDLFFSDSASQIEQAKAICRQCPVREDCLSQALQNKEEFGVWGGLDRDERRRLLRRGRRAATPSSTGAA